MSVSKAVARGAVDDVFATIGKARADGETVQLARYGTFGTRSRPARSGPNPRTGEAVSIHSIDIADRQGGKDVEECRQLWSQGPVNGAPACLPPQTVFERAGG